MTVTLQYLPPRPNVVHNAKMFHTAIAIGTVFLDVVTGLCTTATGNQQTAASIPPSMSAAHNPAIMPPQQLYNLAVLNANTRPFTPTNRPVQGEKRRRNKDNDRLRTNSSSYTRLQSALSGFAYQPHGLAH